METQEVDESKSIYTTCLQKQLEEIDLMSSIYCNPGEIHIYDPTVISDINEYIDGKTTNLNTEMDFSIFFPFNSEKIEIRIQLPHLYPLMENAKVVLRTTLLSKDRERNAQVQIENFISTLDKSEPYIYQVVSWIQDEIENFLNSKTGDLVRSDADGKCNDDDRIDVERLWIYSHHIKSKMKRQEILHQAQKLCLTGFSRPGKPGIICVEGLKDNTQEFWKIIRSLRWQKITIKRIESKRKAANKIDEWRRFESFKEKIFTDIESDVAGEKMNMSLFLEFLEQHKCNYMRQELFGFE